MTGRIPKFTPAIRRAIIESIEGGNYIETSVSAVGVSTATFYRWINDPRPAYVAFRDACARARAEAEERAIACVREQAREDWRAAAWFLERSYPQRWGPPKREVELSGTPEAPLYLAAAPRRLDTSALPPATLKALLAAMPEDEDTVTIEVVGEVVEEGEG